MKGFESNQVRNHEAKKTHTGRSYSIVARVRRQPIESGKVLPAEADFSADLAPLAQEVWADPLKM